MEKRKALKAAKKNVAKKAEVVTEDAESGSDEENVKGLLPLYQSATDLHE